MGWKFNWVSANKSDFNYDFYASFRKSDVRSKKAFFNFKLSNPETSDREGISTFYKDTRGNIFYTYSTFARGIDLINTTYNLLDLTAKGRDEDSAESHGWLNYHDMY